MASVSFEYFPPRSAEGGNLLDHTVEVLSAYQPDFQSVTYGAGGSSREGTLQTLKNIAEKGAKDTASHLTYTGSKASEIAEFANTLWNEGVKRIVALRGDDRSVDGEEVFANTAQFIRTLKRYHPFEVAVSCYPETHPKAVSRAADISVLKEKQDAGASIAISQFFFDNTVFYDFVEEAQAAGVTIPIVPGILPIYNFERVKAMAADCGATVPQYVHDAFEAEATSGSGPLEIASELLKAQVHDLAIAGFESIHIYTLNRIALADAAARTFLSAHKKPLERSCAA